MFLRWKIIGIGKPELLKLRTIMFLSCYISKYNAESMGYIKFEGM